HVTREKGTEAPFTGKFDKFFKDGTYSCVCCKTHYFALSTSTTPAAAGRHFSKRMTPRRESFAIRTTASLAGRALKFCAAPAAPTSATCSRTGRSRLVSATASTRPV
ncbi:hypothetical protein BOX15_Mlig000620g6, partial [Macrostomum lignano]